MSPVAGLAAAGIVLVGVAIGFQVAYQASVGGLSGSLTAAFLAFALGGLIVILVLAGLLLHLFPPGRRRLPSRIALTIAGSLLVGGLVGYLSVPVLGLEYRPPLVLSAAGFATADIEESAFVSNPRGTADCWSVADSELVGSIVALNLGELTDGTLRGQIDLTEGETGAWNVAMWIDGSDLPEGAVQPHWQGEGVPVDTSGNLTTGRASFNVGLIADPKLGDPEGAWPTTLTGDLSWSCEPWLDPDATPAAPSSARASLDLEDPQWIAADGSTSGSCSFEADGSVETVVGEGLGTLSGKPVTASLSLVGRHQTGDVAQIFVYVQAVPAETPTGWGLPQLLGVGRVHAATSGQTVSWSDVVVLDDLSAGGRAGRVSFVNLPREGTLPVGWQATLSGSFSWSCDD